MWKDQLNQGNSLFPMKDGLTGPDLYMYMQADMH